MGISRHYLGWQRPALVAAADFLIARCAGDGQIDLSAAVVVVPGGRAGRRLLEVLLERAQSDGRALVPPEICTVGRLPELLYQPQRTFADALVQQLAWAAALRASPTETIRSIVPQPPEPEDAPRWMELATLFQRQHTELAADGLDFAAVAEATRRIGQTDEARRWQAMRQVQSAYLERLDALQLWDIQTARLVAIQQRECHTERELVLLATVDMSRAMRQMLDQVATHVTALVHAPPEWADRFDQYGCLAPQRWRQLEIDVPGEQIHLADDPADQADTAARCVADFQGRYRADEISIGVPDERLLPHLQRTFQQCDVTTRWGPGRPIGDTSPVRFLAALGNYLERSRFHDLAALVRHPDLVDWMARHGVQGDWLSELDRYFAEHLPSRLYPGKLLGPIGGRRQVEQVVGRVHELIAPLRGRVQPLGSWSDPLADVLLALYGDRRFDRDDPADRGVLAACSEIRQVLEAHREVPAELAPETNAAEAVRLLLGQLASQTVPAESDDDAIELLGWLELPLDDAPALVVTTVNEHFVPDSVDADPFLPNSLRSELGLIDNARRYARDAYALSVLLASRQQLQLVVGRRDAEGNPLTPSRLLLAGAGETLAARARRFFQPIDPHRPRQPLAGAVRVTRSDHDFAVPRPSPLAEPITSMSVTAFRDYLACPYRFYLARVLRLAPLDDAAEELDGAAFGNLLHEVVRRFGSGDARHATDPERIAEQLRHALNQCAEETFGRIATAPVAVQLQQARLRLEAFALAQAAWAGEGWRIEYVEASTGDEPAALTVDGEPMRLTGRIDRIDFHPESGRWAVFDYKSSDSASRPEEAHRRGDGTWTDLQLPLYRYLAQSLGIDAPVQLGYVNLPKDVGKIGFVVAEWTDAELADADRAAAEVVRAVRAEQFWPPAEPPPRFSESLAAICHDGVLDRSVAQEAPP